VKKLSPKVKDFPKKCSLIGIGRTLIMDASTVVIIGFFVLFGVLEYQERERRHRSRIAWMRLRRTPVPDGEGPPLWKILTTTAVTLLLAAFVVITAIIGVRGGMAGSVPLTIVAATLLPVLLLLVLIILRDVRALIAYRRSVNNLLEESSWRY
jgi:hypothetical protein